MTEPILVLVGAPGAGKTTVGLLVAARLGVEFLDTDHVVEERAGKPIPEIFYDEGEAAFRALETAALADTLASHPGVLALGGGVVLRPENRAALAGHRVVHLRVGLADAVARVGLARNRPVLAISPRATLRHLLEERAPLYAEVATDVVDTDGRDPEDVAADVAALVVR